MSLIFDTDFFNNNTGGGGGGAVINDNTPSASTVYSSSKVETLLTDKVLSADIKNIVKLTQSEYNALENKSSTTFYIIQG